MAATATVPSKQLRRQYQAGFMTALAKPATTARHVKVLNHVLGFFKKQVDVHTRHELLDRIADYRRGLAPLMAPLTLIRHYTRLLEISSLCGQAYLNPDPIELALRNRV
jgi:uncharacterized protein YbgA (DUF1722 family)